jgi:hypothetical protein
MMSSRAVGRCTLTTTRSPVSSVARWTWPIVPAASGCGSTLSKTSSHAELGLHHRDDLRLRQRRDVVLEVRELVDELRRQQVGPRREDLAELGEGRSELLEREAELPRPRRLGAVATPLDPVAQAVPAEDERDPAGAAEQPGGALGHRSLAVWTITTVQGAL